MNKVLKLLQQRYGRIVIIGAVLIIGYCVSSGINFSNNWQLNYDYFTSEEFTADFDETDSYHEFSDSQGNIVDNYYQTLEEYQDSFFYLFIDAGGTTYTPHSYQKGYIPGNNYYYNYNKPSQISIFLFILIGFALFFIDLKTAFNTLLFSSGCSRKKIFLGKILTVALPLLLALAVGLLLQLAIIKFNIPAEYFNSELGPLLNSIVHTWSMAFLWMAMGIFIGTLTGNLVLAPLTLAVFSYYLLGIPDVANSIERLMKGLNADLTNKVYIYMETGLLKQHYPITLTVGVLLLGIGFLLLAQLGYQKISLENNGHYLLVPRWRLPIFGFMATVSLLFWNLIRSSPLVAYQYQISYENANNSLVSYVLQFLLQAAIIIGICGVVVYSDAILRKLQSHWEKRVARI